jgi:hypothetical protein
MGDAPASTSTCRKSRIVQAAHRSSLSLARPPRCGAIVGTCQAFLVSISLTTWSTTRYGRKPRSLNASRQPSTSSNICLGSVATPMRRDRNVRACSCASRHGTFEYVFDHYTSFEDARVVPYSVTEEGRLVIAFGRSAPLQRPRDDNRLRKWIGPTERAFGREWDKGHYIAHSLGGAVEGVEANVFVQRRDLNRGWSVEGKHFREMEKYCFANAGTLCFARPIYADGTSRAAWLEFGVMRCDGNLWVECFDNRGNNSDKFASTHGCACPRPCE